MDFEQKLNIVIREIALVYNLNDKQANIIKRNIISRVNMYQNVHPDFANDETKIVVNSSNVGDFFINRLVTNIRCYDFDQTYNTENTLKGAYTSKDQSIFVANYDFIKKITLDKLKKRIRNVDSEMLGKATLNVFNHEMGHALQTSFKGKYGNNDNKYAQLISNLCTKYPNVFKLQATDAMLTARHVGMKATRKDDKSKDARNFYANNKYATHLDEIFNEDEALRVTGAKQPQFSYDIGNGFSKKIYNYQSSNYRITSYGRMMKIVMGEKLSFKAMYEDSIVAYDFFDQFKDISDKIYKGKPPMYNVLDSLERIKRDFSLIESQKLELFLVECFQRKVAFVLKSPNITQDDIDEIKNYISEFNKLMTKNPNLVTQQDQIISKINSMVLEKEKQLVSSQNSNTVQTNINKVQTGIPLYSHSKADELNEIERKKQFAKQNDDISLYQQLHSKINIQEQALQTEVKENNMSNDNLDLSGPIGQLRNELTKVQKSYRSMMSDGFIDNEELATLIAMNNKIINDGYLLKELATESSDLRIINVIVSNLEELQKKMNTAFNDKKVTGSNMI